MFRSSMPFIFGQRSQQIWWNQMKHAEIKVQCAKCGTLIPGSLVLSWSAPPGARKVFMRMSMSLGLTCDNFLAVSWLQTMTYVTSTLKPILSRMRLHSSFLMISGGAFLCIMFRLVGSSCCYPSCWPRPGAYGMSSWTWSGWLPCSWPPWGKLSPAVSSMATSFSWSWGAGGSPPALQCCEGLFLAIKTSRLHAW